MTTCSPNSCSKHCSKLFLFSVSFRFFIHWILPKPWNKIIITHETFFSKICRELFLWSCVKVSGCEVPAIKDLYHYHLYCVIELFIKNYFIACCLIQFCYNSWLPMDALWIIYHSYVVLINSLQIGLLLNHVELRSDISDWLHYK